MRYGDDSSAEEKDDDVKEVDPGKETLQSLVQSSRFLFKNLNLPVIITFTEKCFCSNTPWRSKLRKS